MNPFLHKLALYSFATLFLWAAGSCKQRGCMDADAENYEPKAGVDCNCCYYGAKGVGWFKKDFSDKMQSQGVTSLKYYVNNALLNESEFRSFSYSVNGPTFARDNSDYSYYREGDKNLVVVDLEGMKMRLLPVRVTDQNGKTVWSGNVTFTANTIIAFELF